MTLEEIVEAGGAAYIGRLGDSVRFRDPKDDFVFTLYVSAVSVENVRLTLKNHREDLVDPWWAPVKVSA